MTRSTAEMAKVTPQALMHCKSHGASMRSVGSPAKAAVIGSSSKEPRSLPAGTEPDHAFSSSLTVGELRETSWTRPLTTMTVAGPAPASRRPTNSALRQSFGRC
jgi:hypothetical protein